MTGLSEFALEVDGLRIQCWQGGSGTPLLLLHGSGPGSATPGTWRTVFEPLMARYHVFATDLIGFGRSDRKRQEPFFDLNLWLRQAQAVLAHMPGEEVGVIGHSLSGATALRLGGVEPRVRKVMTTGTMGTAFASREHTARPWIFPETREDLRFALSVITYRQAGISEDMLDQRMAILHDGVYGPYFRSMFAGDKQRFVDEAALSDEELVRLTCPVMLVHGREDAIIPYDEASLALLAKLPRADALILSECGHLPATEQPEKFMAAVHGFFG
jgi:2-hydroxymuconate-semialdehyde hydrolase